MYIYLSVLIKLLCICNDHFPKLHIRNLEGSNLLIKWAEEASVTSRV